MELVRRGQSQCITSRRLIRMIHNARVYSLRVYSHCFVYSLYIYSLNNAGACVREYIHGSVFAACYSVLAAASVVLSAGASERGLLSSTQMFRTIAFEHFRGEIPHRGTPRFGQETDGHCHDSLLKEVGHAAKEILREWWGHNRRNMLNECAQYHLVERVPRLDEKLKDWTHVSSRHEMDGELGCVLLRRDGSETVTAGTTLPRQHIAQTMERLWTLKGVLIDRKRHELQ